MIWAMIPGPVKRAGVWLLAGLAVAWGIWTAGKREARQQTALEAAERINQTIEEMRRHAREAESQDDPALIDRLSERP